jgi:hypothetical protein
VKETAQMNGIDDPRFLKQVSRRFLDRPSGFLDGSPIEVIENACDATDLEIRITNGLCPVMRIAWSDQHASVLPGSPLLAADDLFLLEEAFTSLVRRFLRKHRFIDSNGRSTRRRTA